MNSERGGDPYVHGNSFANGTMTWSKQQRDTGFSIRPVSSYDLVEGNLPA